MFFKSYPNFSPRLGEKVNAVHDDGASELVPYQHATGLNLVNFIGDNTNYTVGPTTSFKDKVWAALDGLPNGIDHIFVKVKYSASTGTANGHRPYALLVAGGDVDLTNDVAHTELAFTLRTDAGGNAYNPQDGVKHFCIPVDSEKFFMCRRNNAGVTDAAMTMYLVGYGYNKFGV